MSIPMKTNDWQPEIRAAARWWATPVQEAIDKAFPRDNLFGSLGDAFRKQLIIEDFISRLSEEIEKHFIATNAEWNRQVPLESAMRRRVGIEGAFRSTPLVNALKACGMEEVMPFIPDGCMTVISPGRVFAARSRRDKDEIIEVKAPPIPSHIEGMQGYGI